MKTILLAMLALGALAASVPASAGPDWSVIERARAEARARHALPCAQSAHAVPASGPPASPATAR
ncbi:hypothetical protein [Cupriavidus consociatus]|uniref:hypothetical protein n=1 Tax=Cupriavidus consociatus TaxID=2821357 RepID=UPI001AE3B28B|nr:MULTISPECIES: hypothetical protein [unclassified Cupriavidus]MBP0623276.1 hypothetical protein [Cupriavidus sp. LEh25]MDK2659969.1 hypothetical protein [Cupriavidus sp. LEh21]